MADYIPQNDAEFDVWQKNFAAYAADKKGELGLVDTDLAPLTAAHAALGGRTLKTGQSRWLVGCNKHSFRLWWRAYSPAVWLVPLVSGVAPANVAAGGGIGPSLHYCVQRGSGWPRQVVAAPGDPGPPKANGCAANAGAGPSGRIGVRP